MLTSTEESENVGSPITVYPNPSTGNFTIDPSNDALYNYQVYDSQGRLIFSKKDNQGSTFFSLDNQGLYFLISDVEGVRSAQKLIVD